MNTDYRNYMGRHLIFILARYGKKALIIHLEDGYVGNKDIGYKQVKKDDIDITMIRMCRKIK